MLYGFINFVYRRMNVIASVRTVSRLTVHPYVYEWELVASLSKWLRMTLNYDLLYKVFDYFYFFDISSNHPSLPFFSHFFFNIDVSVYEISRRSFQIMIWWIDRIEFYERKLPSLRPLLHFFCNWWKLIHFINLSFSLPSFWIKPHYENIKSNHRRLKMSACELKFGFVYLL